MYRLDGKRRRLSAVLGLVMDRYSYQSGIFSPDFGFFFLLLFAVYVYWSLSIIGVVCDVIAPSSGYYSCDPDYTCTIQ